MKKQAGFTLIEIIVTLMLSGILASFAGFGIVSAVKGYLFAKNNTIIAGKAQVAMSRMTRELLDLRDVPHPAANPSSSIEFDKALEKAAIGQSGTEIKLKKGSLGATLDYTTGDVLANQVGSLRFAFKKGSADWAAGDDITLLSHIVISLTMSGVGEGSNYTFTTTVSPRNNGNAGGTSFPTMTTLPPITAGRCFVATAAFGNPYHPMVILLKQFRDQYLATWAGGRALMQLYYREGPYIAEIIQDKPWACALARLLLLPFVGLSFLLVYAQGSIPLVMLIIIAGIWLIKRYPLLAHNNKKGSVLIGIIFTMVVMSILGAAMVSLNTSSGLSQAYGSMSHNAYYLAESGFRYTGSQFLNAVDNENNGNNENQNATANDIHGRTITLAEGSMTLSVTPFHVATSAAAAIGATTLSVRFPGGTPPYFAIPATGTIQILTWFRPNSTTAYTTYANTYNYTAFAGSTFTLSTPLVRAVPAWATVKVIARPSVDQTVTPDINPSLTTNRLILTKPAGGFFMPARNGKFTVQGNQAVYTYDYRDNVTTTELTTTLYGVRNANDPANHTPFSVTPTSGIIPNDFFTIVSTGTAGGASRTLTFITPVDVTAQGGVPGQKTTYADSVTSGVNPGADASNWFAASAGGYSAAAVAGAQKADGTTGTTALQLTSSLPYGGSGSVWGGTGNDKHFSFMALKWSANYANFYNSWYSHANTLSYDAQVKIKLPQANDYYMAGMLFRLKMVDSVANSSWLGVSFLRGQNGENSGTDRDGIEDGVVPLNNVPMIVIWRKNTGQELSGMQWVAYKIISTNGFHSGSAPLFVNGSSYYIRGATSGARANGTVVTNDVGVTGEFLDSAAPSNAEKFGTFQNNEPLFQLAKQTPNSAIVTGDSATRINFSDGQTGIAVGDIIVGSDSHASARVTAVSSWGNWNKGKASGYVDIEQKQGNFNDGGGWSTGEELQIYRPNAARSALFRSILPLDILTADTPYIKDWSTLLLRLEEKSANTTPFNGQYVNDIKIYVGDTSLHGTPTGSPLDGLRYKNERWSNPPATDDVQWPPDTGWSSNLAENLSRDHFTLVTGWVVNPALSSSFSLTGTGEEPNSTIRTNTFTTNSLSTFTQQEIGLQTAGPAAMENNTYFDDFAVQMEGGATGSQNGFTIPLQY